MVRQDSEDEAEQALVQAQAQVGPGCEDQRGVLKGAAFQLVLSCMFSAQMLLQWSARHRGSEFINQKSSILLISL